MSILLCLFLLLMHKNVFLECDFAFECSLSWLAARLGDIEWHAYAVNVVVLEVSQRPYFPRCVRRGNCALPTVYRRMKQSGATVQLTFSDYRDRNHSKRNSTNKYCFWRMRVYFSVEASGLWRTDNFILHIKGLFEYVCLVCISWSLKTPESPLISKKLEVWFFFQPHHSRMIVQAG